MSQVSLKYEAVGRSPQDAVVYAIMDKEFISAVGPASMRDLFENRAAIIQSGSELAIVVKTGGEVDQYITSAIDIAIDGGFRVEIEDSSIRSPGAESDVKPSFGTISEMVDEVRRALSRKKTPEASNDQVSPA